jgi:hypothetical protein
VSVALRILLRTSTSTSVPFLCQPFSTYPIAMLVPTDGEGIPDVTAPRESSFEAVSAMERQVT